MTTIDDSLLLLLPVGWQDRRQKDYENITPAEGREVQKCHIFPSLIGIEAPLSASAAFMAAPAHSAPEYSQMHLSLQNQHPLSERVYRAAMPPQKRRQAAGKNSVTLHIMHDTEILTSRQYATCHGRRDGPRCQRKNAVCRYHTSECHVLNIERCLRRQRAMQIPPLI